MSELVTDEIVEAAARALFEHVAETTQEMESEAVDEMEVRRSEAYEAIAAAAPLIAARALEEMRAEVQGWHVYETRDIGDAFRADAVVDLIQDRLDGLAKEGRG